MKRRNLLQMSGLSLSLAIAGCFRDDSDESEQREVFEDPNPQLFDGEGPTIIEEVRNEGGFFAVEYEHDGDGDFTVELRSEEASHSLVLVDREGAVEGRWAEGTYDAEYVIEVTATGDWHLRVEQPRPSQEDVFSLPASLSGEWPDYAGPYEFTGQTSINATYSGRAGLSLVFSALTATLVNPSSKRIAHLKEKRPKPTTALGGCISKRMMSGHSKSIDNFAALIDRLFHMILCLKNGISTEPISTEPTTTMGDRGLG